jgi:H+-translocating NAD(P) transhydrogenase subunit beta
MNTLSTLKETIVALVYLISAVFFILGIKRLSHPKTAVQGNQFGAIGMLIASLNAFLDFGVVIEDNGTIAFTFAYWYVIVIALVFGSVLGVITSQRVKMTGMPQMVALLNGFGGFSSLIVAGVYYYQNENATLSLIVLIATMLSGLIGAITLTGSYLAYAKLEGIKWVPDQPVRFKGDLIFKITLLLVLLGVGTWFSLQPSIVLFLIMVIGASLLGIFLVIGIGGADMPVVIALLNSYSGLAAAATGFVLNNVLLIITGSLVGASGLILSATMCKAMNRSLLNVLFGGFGAVAVQASGEDIYAGKVKQTSSEEVAMILQSCSRVVIVPGFGMAVARASNAVKQLCDVLEKSGIEVVFGIHPVAGRMPGHMNVLLAEESIAYEKMFDLETINPTFKNTDLVLVIGANDVVNPLTRDPKSSIAGMPILNVDEAKTCVVIKRSLGSGFAGLANPLFTYPQTLMLLNDAKKAIEGIVKSYKEL